MISPRSPTVRSQQRDHGSVQTASHAIFPDPGNWSGFSRTSPPKDRPSIYIWTTGDTTCNGGVTHWGVMYGGNDLGQVTLMPESRSFDRGLPLMTSVIISDFFTPSPLVRKFTQPPLLRLFTTSAFEGTPFPPLCGRHKWKPP